MANITYTTGVVQIEPVSGSKLVQLTLMTNEIEQQLDMNMLYRLPQIARSVQILSAYQCKSTLQPLTKQIVN